MRHASCTHAKQKMCARHQEMCAFSFPPATGRRPSASHRQVARSGRPPAAAFPPPPPLFWQCATSSPTETAAPPGETGGVASAVPRRPRRDRAAPARIARGPAMRCAAQESGVLEDSRGRGEIGSATLPVPGDPPGDPRRGAASAIDVLLLLTIIFIVFLAYNRLRGTY